MHDGTPLDAAQGIYGHEVLNLLVELGGAAPVETLRSAALEAFGPEAVYCNCHGGRFNFDQLMEFFSSRGKVEIDGQSVRLGSVQPCSGH
jgi:probable metal-binding protein